MKLFKENFAAELIRRKFSRAPQFLQDRLATTMLQRRQHFLYLKWHHSAQRARPSKAVLSNLRKSNTPPNAAAPVLSAGKTYAPRIGSYRVVPYTSLNYQGEPK
jgi:hypothetical protein